MNIAIQSVRDFFIPQSKAEIVTAIAAAPFAAFAGLYLSFCWYYGFFRLNPIEFAQLLYLIPWSECLAKLWEQLW
jgi:hypothetical protein